MWFISLLTNLELNFHCYFCFTQCYFSVIIIILQYFLVINLFHIPLLWNLLNCLKICVSCIFLSILYLFILLILLFIWLSSYCIQNPFWNIKRRSPWKVCQSFLRSPASICKLIHFKMNKFEQINIIIIMKTCKTLHNINA